MPIAWCKKHLWMGFNTSPTCCAWFRMGRFKQGIGGVGNKNDGPEAQADAQVTPKEMKTGQHDSLHFHVFTSIK